MTVSEITASDVAEYLRIAEPTTEDTTFLTTCIAVAKDYILKYTGIEDEEELNEFQDMVIVIYVLCQDMYDTRAMYVDNDKLNVVVETILGMHQRNLL